MEALTALERKVTELLLFVGQMKTENGKLTKENADLKRKLEAAQKVASEKNSTYDQEVTSAKVIVDSLIKDIDAVVGNERA